MIAGLPFPADWAAIAIVFVVVWVGLDWLAERDERDGVPDKDLE